ncbi:peptidase domain-containing ABC transporter [Staphylococcus pseudintermedius]|uniref:peptidase domain-containing ABC transporter n=1 Tax=Staphylococcus pseudintermedius TaxID=283734 RepID=UPI002ED8A2DF
MKKVPYISQVQESECGLCCVAMIMGYHKDKISVKTLTQHFEIGRDGISLNKLKDILNKYDYDVKLYEASTSMLHKVLNEPLIIFWDDSHYVILEKIHKNKFTIVDPNIGRITIDYNDFNEKFSNVILWAAPKNNRDKIIEKNNYFSIYKEFLIKNKKSILGLLCVSIFSYIAMLTAPILMRYFTSDFSNTTIYKDFINISIIITSFLMYTYIYILKSFIIVRFSSKMDENIYNKIIKKLLSVPYSFYLTRSSSDLLYRLSLLKTNREFIVDSILKGIIDIGMIITINIIMLTINTGLFIYTLLITSIMFCVMYFIRKKILKNHKLEIIENTKLQGYEYEVLSAMFTVKASKQEKFMEKLITDQYYKSLEYFKKRATINNIYSSFIAIFSTFGPLGIFVVSLFIIKDDFNLSIAIFAYTILGVYFSSLGNVFNAFNIYGTLQNNLERITDILEHKNQVPNENKINVNSIETIEFKNVSFRYPGQPEFTLKNINFKINKGEKVAFVGKTGSGKSTIIGLILGMYKPEKGDIFINNVSIENLNIENFQNLIGFVPQEPFIFNKSIKNNITMNQEFSIEDVEIAGEIAEINDEIQKMPMKYNTIISESGHNISGGQKQRIILARALIHNPEVLVLDEATSALDNYTEKRIASFFNKYKKTQIVIAHRISTIQNSNKIYVVANGEIVSYGSHKSLIKSSPIYRSFLKKEEKNEFE